jgi:hypothetical protein
MAGELMVIEEQVMEVAHRETVRIDLHVHVHVGQAAGTGDFAHTYVGAASPNAGAVNSGGGSRTASGARKLLSIFFISMAVTGGGFMLLKGGSSPSIKDLWTADNTKTLAEAAAALDANPKTGDFSNQLWQTKPRAGANPLPAANPPAQVTLPIAGGQVPDKTGPALFGLN